MTTLAQRRLRVATERRRRERDGMIRSVGQPIDRITRRLEERLLGIVSAKRGGLDGMLGSATVAWMAASVDLSASVEKGLRELQDWAYRSAALGFIRAVPMGAWLKRNVPMLVGVGAQEAIDDALPKGTMAADNEVIKILDGVVNYDGACEIVRRIEFPPPSQEQVEAVLDATEALDGLNAMERIKTVEAQRIPELRELLTKGFGRQDKASFIDWMAPRLRELVGNDPGKPTGMNYRAKRIARTEGVRVAEAEQRRMYAEAGDLLDGVRWNSARVPRSRDSHVALHGRVYYRTAGGGYQARDGERLPPVPLGPNCLCWTEPELDEELTKGIPEAEYGTGYKKGLERYRQQAGE